MNINDPFQAIQTSFHTVLGAASAFTAVLQNPQKNLTNYLTQIQQKPERLLQDLAVTGKKMEQDIANFVNTYFCGGGTPQSAYSQYVERADGQAFNQPYEIKGTKMYGFVIEGSMTKLQEICDKYLNNVSNGQIEYRPATHYVILTFNDIESLNSIEPPDRDKGTVFEQEAIFWMLTVVGKKVGPLFVAERLAWFMPYLYVNNSPVLVSGREVYGLFKELGTFQFFTTEQQPDLLTLNTLAFKKFAPDAKIEDARLLEVKRIGQGAKHAAIKNWDNLNEAIAAIASLLFDNEIVIPGLELPFNLLEYLIKKDVPFVSLKQFRDVKDSKKACYQSVVEAVMQLQTFHHGRLFGFNDWGDRYELTINNFASQPLVQDMGLHKGFIPGSESISIPVKLSFLLNFDFTLNNGTTVWQVSQK